MIAPAPVRRRPQLARTASPQAARREALFARRIDYVPCRQFLAADAELLATTPPADAVVPLSHSGVEAPVGRDVTPYLASLYQSRLLSKDEEQFYFRRMNWLKFKAATVRGQLDPRRASPRQVAAVEALLTEAEAVRSVVITANLRLVVSIAKKFIDLHNSFDELVAEGNMALLRAVEKFNFALGNRFSTYATYAIQRHFFRISHRSRQFRSRFMVDDAALKDRPESTEPSPYCSAEQIALLRDLFGRFLDELEPRERQIVVARFGFDGRAPRTFRELGSEMGVCKERIRQLQSRAMEKLKSMAAEAHLDRTVGDWL
ncbi:MAG: sigma-70 family RNA polymerase sigma factor [Planctomycetia bacterium]|nr:sigma-70 family RNA polymerase sigma factor [Planctomycetia bacterium]